MPVKTPRDLFKVSMKLYYKGGNPAFVAMQVLRPFICPFGELIKTVPAGAEVLDIGCGGGLFLGLLAAERNIGSSLGFDVSAPAIESALAMRRNHPRGDTINFEHRSVTEPWPDRGFDVVSLIDIVHHLAPEQRKDMIQRACSRVRAGGILLYKDMVTTPRWMVWTNTVHDLLIAQQLTKVQDLDEIKAWCIDAGLYPDRASFCRMLWYGHDIVVFRKA